MTDWAVRPVRTCLPPMTSGMSMRSAAIALRRALSSARSGDPGAYARTGSLTGGGTLRFPLNAVRRGSSVSSATIHPLEIRRVTIHPIHAPRSFVEDLLRGAAEQPRAAVGAGRIADEEVVEEAPVLIVTEVAGPPDSRCGHPRLRAQPHGERGVGGEGMGGKAAAAHDRV